MDEAFSEQSLHTFLSRLGSDLPAPGGGAAAGVSGALGAALGRMVAELTRGRAKYAEWEPDAVRASDALLPLIDRFTTLAEADAAAYNGYMSALALPKSTDAERAERAAALDRAIRTATDVPCRVIETAEETIAIIERLVGKSNRTCAGDLAAGAAALRSAGKTAWLNVLANLPYYPDKAEAKRLYERQKTALDRLTVRCDKVYDTVESGLFEKIES